MDPDTKALLSILYDLYKQATIERSHYYTAAGIKDAIETIERYDRNLAGRDSFIVSKGLWSDFVSQLPRQS